jgi:glucose/arabinose dehydrogenase
MLINRVRSWGLALLMMLVASCGGGGGNPGFGASMPGASTGSLAITVTGLPAGISAVVRVTGPANFSRDIVGSQALANLAPGSYTIAAASAMSGAVTYAPNPATQTVTVAPGATAIAAIGYGGMPPLAIGLREVARGLVDPVLLTSPANDQRQFIVERDGRIRIMQDGIVLTLPFLDISARVSTSGEGGLLSMGFDPNYSGNGHFFVYYTDLARNIVIERYSVSPNPSLADPASALTILTIPHPTFVNHFGGLLSFGPDGYLYIGTGDGGGEGDPQRNGQNLDVLLGKLLRLDVSASSSAQRYAIPPSNPFAAQAGRRAEIWAYGLRNPWRYAFDGTQLYSADVGQDRREEVNIAGIAQGGQNYGWNIMEGTLCFLTPNCSTAGLTLPAFEYDHGPNDANGCSITGGFVYRGKAIPEVAGRYFYSDYCGGYLKSFLASAAGITELADWGIPNVGRIVSFGRDADGELYLLAASGTIYKMVRTSAPTS